MSAGSLQQFIESSECLNEDHAHPVANLWSENPTFLQSDTDHQLLIKVTFRSPVRVSALRFTALDEDTRPTEIKVFVNEPHLGFSDVEDKKGVQNFCLTTADCNIGGGEQNTELKYALYQCVTNFTIFVQENGGDDVTKLQQVQFLGVPAESSDIADWKPVKS